MIEISKVSESFFPESDFKFRNAGKTAAVLSQFTLRVLDAKVDPTPVLNFHFRVENGHFISRGNSAQFEQGDDSLELIAQNNGWGPAIDCELLFSEPAIDQIFSADKRRLTCTIESKKLVSLRLDPMAISPPEFALIHPEFGAQAA